MEVEALLQQTCVIYPFLKATKGNWRNAIYITCDCVVCPYGHNPNCEGYLLSASSDGTPLVLSVERYRAISKEHVDSAECCGKISRRAFEACHSLYLQWHLSSMQDCPLHTCSQVLACSCNI